jgi:chaperonin GroES
VSASAPRVHLDPRDGEAAPDAQSPSTFDSPHRGGAHRVGFHQAARGPHRHQEPRGRADDRVRSCHPDTAKEKPQEGEVLAVGPGRIDDKGNRVPLDVNVGDRVIYSKYGGTEIKHGGEEFLILSARDVLAIVG